MCCKKTVSVVMCTFNGEKFLKEQLESIIHQTYPIEEIIIQDDCSEDETVKLIKGYSIEYPHIVFSVNDMRMGVNRNFFSALMKAKGDYVAIADQDDIWELDKIRIQISEIGDNLLNFHLSEPFSSDGVPILFDKRTPNYSILRMIYFNMIPGHTMLFKKELLDKIYNKQLFLYDALIAIAAGVEGRVNFTNRVLVHHRRYVDAFSYHLPVSNRKSLSNVFSYSFISLKHLFANRDKVYLHFDCMYVLLSQYISDDKRCSDFDVALKFCELYKEQSICSLIKASFLCVKSLVSH